MEKILVSACLLGEKVRYDGSFAGILKNGKGVTAALFERNGIRLFSEKEIEKAASFIKSIK